MARIAINPMRRFEAFTGSAVRFAVVFAILIIPWPGWNEIYGAYFRALGTFCFSNHNEQRIVQFQPHREQHGFSSIDSQILLTNRALVDSTGTGRVEEIGLDTRSIGWVPTALTVALIVATPMPFGRRFWSLVMGLLAINAFILFSLQVWIWDASAAVSLLSPSNVWQGVLDEMQYALLTQIGASFSVPVLIWILVGVRPESFLRSGDDPDGGPILSQR